MLDTSYVVAASVLAQTLLLGRITLLGIWRSSNGICWLLIWGITSAVAYLLIYRDSAEPPYLWRAGDHVFTLILFALAVRSMTNLMLYTHEAIRRVASKFLALLTVIAIALLVAIILPAHLGDSFAIAPALRSSGLTFEMGLAFYWAILLVFSIWFRIAPSRNALVHGTCLAAYLFVACIGSIMGAQATRPLVTAAEVVIFSIWAILVSREGEQGLHPQASQTS